MSYKDSLNLPKTKFSMKANLPRLEPEILEFWEELDLYEDKILNSSFKEGEYVLHDGPPYANGDIHIGHALNKVLKDIIVKFETMNGKKAIFVPGWDCHGLPVEYSLFKKMKKNKHEVDIMDFRKQAYDYAMKYVDVQKKEFIRLGIFGLWDDPYLTVNSDYEFIMLKTLAKLVGKGYVYRGLKPVNWCSQCETALAEAEVEYKTKESPSIYIKFPIKSESEDKTYLLVWTTTPWTLLGNVACALNPDLDYVKVKNVEESEYYIFAKKLLAEVAEKSKINYKIVDNFSAKDLKKIKVKHPFLDRESKVILSDFVSGEEGTGCVHIAPGHGEEDYKVGKEYNLSMYMPVDDKGLFIEKYRNLNKDLEQEELLSVPDWLIGKHVFKANHLIIEKLTSQNNLFYSEDIAHSYPTCWRCKTSIIFRATKQWFMSVGHSNLRERILKVTDEINWVPSKGKRRFDNMIQNRPDWCLSRQRLWGVPIPAFTCVDCKEDIISEEIVNDIADLVLESGSNVWFEKKGNELIKDLKCPFCGSGNIEKLNDILDVWFESGISHSAVLKHSKQGLSYPAQLYLEGSDQHRGWFQTSILTAMATENNSPFENILTHGFVVDAEGKKMSKSKGNVVSPLEIFNKYGADVLRLWVISCDYTSDVKISKEILSNIAEAYRKIRNTMKFSLGNIYDFDLDKKVDYDSLLEIDKWILLRVMQLVKYVEEQYKNFNFYKIYRQIYNFCIVDLSSFYFDVLKDRLYIYKDDSLERRSAQTAIYHVLINLVKLVAPVLPFTAEEVWQHLPDSLKDNHNESVHLEEFPDLKEEWIVDELYKKWDKLLSFRDTILKAIESKRAEGLIGSSLEAKISLYTEKENLINFFNSFEYDLKYVLIVSEISLIKVDDLSEVDNYDLELETFKIRVEKSKGEKCQRCWNYSKTVGECEEYDDICTRCVEQIKL